MLELNNFLINNFKIFKGEHWFSFRDLNVFTGPNNTGKSSFIKAMQLFTEGYKNSDFPLLDLIGGVENLGEFNQVVNNKSNEKKFGFGFSVLIRNIKQPFNVVYTFQDGIHENPGTASFLSVEIIDAGGDVFFGLYDHYRYWGDEDLSPLKSPFTGSDWTSMINGKLNLMLLKKYAKSISPHYDISGILDYLEKTFGEIWWFEAFKEYDGYTNTIFYKRFNDLLQEMTDDVYTNLADYNLKEDIHFTDSDNTDEINRYYLILKRTNYRDFLTEIISPIFNAIENKLAIFRINKSNQIKSSDFLQGSLFPLNKETEFLYQVLKQQKENDYKDFVYKSNKIFGFDTFTLISFIENSGFIIKLHKIINPKPKKTESSIYDILGDNFKVGKPIVNLSNYGKGTINIITLILKTASIIFDEKKNNREIENFKIKKSSDRKLFKNIILVEEPEAFLHPDWQSKLADFFAYCIKKFNVQFFIETHSEYLVRRLQVLTAKKEISPNDSVIYYFNPPEMKVRIKELHIREDGMMDDDFGPRFFDESIRSTVDLLKLQNKN
jgi:hypothetical protein